jgi:uncharacterized repeat protein (TIGR01451 family)
MKTQPTLCPAHHPANLKSAMRITAFIALVALVVIPFFSSSSASSSRQLDGRGSSAASVVKAQTAPPALKVAERAPSSREAFNAFLPLMPQSSSESVATYAGDCTTPKSNFVVGDTVCVVASGVPLNPFFPRRLTWATTDTTVVRSTDIVTDPQADSLLITATTLSNGQTIDNRGTWQVVVRNPFFFFPEAEVRFTVTDPANATADVAVDSTSSSSTVGGGSQAVFGLQVTNYGPDSSTNVTLTDAVPANTAFASFVQTSGPSFTCTNPTVGETGTTTCVIATLNSGAVARFVATYDVSSGAASGTLITNTADVFSNNTPTAATDDENPKNNSTTASSTVAATGGGGTCALNCPDNITAIANTTEGSQRGAHVAFDAAEPSGTCGAVTSSPASGSFFPVGTSVVTTTSETGGGSCSFTISIEDQGTNPPTISCPASQTANADSNCAATVNVGTASATGNNVTVIGNRSDGLPMYNCDANGINCTRRSSDDPFSTGVTTITWKAYSHDVPGPYASADDEEAHRTGVALCSQTITINDVTPPTIMVSDRTASADASCMAPVPDYSTLATVSDNCACASSDNSQICDSRQDITVTQSPAAGTMVGLGPHTITLTANDGSSNNNGDGNTTTVQTTFTVNDTTAPTVTAPADSSASANASCQAAVPNYVAGSTTSDNCSTPTLTQSPAAGTLVGLGPHTVTVTATDGAGNHSSDDVVFTVNDTTPPVVTAPADSSASADATCQAPVPNYMTGSTTSDNCSTPTLTQSPAPGTLVGKGPHTVTVTATDAAGNHSSDDVVFTVIDTTPPVISCAADIIVDFNPAVNGATVTYTTPVGTDNCAGATTAQIAGLPSGATFPLGTTTNTFRATDASGNTAMCSFKVTVALTSIIGLDSITISGAGYADSYSSAGGYPATKGSLANLLSNGTITIGGSGKVWGNVRSTQANVNMTGSAQVTGNATAGTTVTTSGSASVGGTRTNNALAPVMTLPSVTACGPPYSSASGISGTYSYNASTGDLTLSGVNIATLANGNYCFHNITLGNSSQLKVNGLVVIKITGTLNTSGATNLNNTTQIPSNLRILSSYTGSNGVILGNSTSIYALIYAPKTDLNISGAAPLFGTFAGKTLIIGNSGAIHYDTQLKAIWPAIWALL